MELSLLICF